MAVNLEIAFPSDHQSYDLISDMPVELLYLVLSFLPIKDAARTSVLSKRWNSIWINLPCLDFSGLYKMRNMKEVVNKIILSRDQQQQIAPIEKLCLRFEEFQKMMEHQNGEDSIQQLLCRWISCVANCSLRELVLLFTYGFGNKLPSTILSAKFLRKLHLHRVFVEEEILQKLFFSCPLMESLKLVFCEGFKSVYVIGLVHLKLLVVAIPNHASFEILEIEAPNLEDLELSWYFLESQSPTCKFNMDTSACLKRLKITGDFMTEKGFSLFVSKCLALENLSIIGGRTFKNTYISSPTAAIGIAVGDRMMQYQLAKYLGNFKGFNTVKLFSKGLNILPEEERRRNFASSPLYGTLNLDVCIMGFLEYPEIVELVDYMLWLSPQVERLSIKSCNADPTDPTYKFVCRKNACEHSSSGPVKFWRHCLKEDTSLGYKQILILEFKD